jgi:hypothetical protein
MYFHRLCVVSYAVQIYTLVKELVLEIAHSHVATFLFFNLSILFVRWKATILFSGSETVGHVSSTDRTPKNIHTTGASVSNYSITFSARIGFNLSLNFIDRRHHWEIKGTYMQ